MGKRSEIWEGLVGDSGLVGDQRNKQVWWNPEHPRSKNKRVSLGRQLRQDGSGPFGEIIAEWRVWHPARQSLRHRQIGNAV